MAGCAAALAVVVNRTDDDHRNTLAASPTAATAPPAVPSSTAADDAYCAGDLTCPATSVPAELRRPLRAPEATGGRCAATVERKVDPTLGPAAGAGPVFSVTGDPRRRSTITMDFLPDPHSVLAESGYGGWKVLWLIAASYRGPVLIRGVGPGASAPVFFSTADSPLRTELRYPPASTTRSARYTDSYVRVRRPGCYAWQVDGTTFSYTITFRVVAAR